MPKVRSKNPVKLPATCCGETFTRPVTYAAHRALRHCVPEGGYQCPDCEKICWHPSAFKSHQRAHEEFEGRFWSKVDKRGPDECWPWLGTIQPGGYGFIQLGIKALKPHRVAYEFLVGPIPEGLTLDHTCHDPHICALGTDCPHRRCVNPAHLEPVTAIENSRRGHGLAPARAARHRTDAA